MFILPGRYCTLELWIKRAFAEDNESAYELPFWFIAFSSTPNLFCSAVKSQAEQETNTEIKKLFTLKNLYIPDKRESRINRIGDK